MKVAVAGRSPGRRGTWAIAFAAATALTVAVLPGGLAHAAQPSPGRIGLQQSDVPGFTRTDPNEISIKDANDQGIDQAFIQCARSTPLLSEFDTGADATESQMYGRGRNPFGTPELAVATAVFTDGQAADAYTAYSTLASSSFQQCWASTMDSLNRAQGITTPNSPTTVTELPTPQYGDGSTAFVMHVHYNALGTAVIGQFGFTVSRSGAVVVMLVTITYGGAFPESLRTSILANIARRMGATRLTASPSPGAGSTPCTAPGPLSSATLLDTQQVGTTLRSRVSYAGWRNVVTSPVTRRTCEWTGPGRGNAELIVHLGVSAPFGLGGAQTQFDADEKAWQSTATVTGVGNAAFWIPYTDRAQGLEVLSGNRLLTVSIQAPVSQQSQHQQDELALARLVVSQLGTTHPGAATGEGDCGLDISLGLNGELTQTLNHQVNEAALHHLPVSAATLTLPANLYMNLAPSLDLGSVDFCSAGVSASLLQNPPFEDPGSSLAVRASGELNVGPAVYSSELASWSSIQGYTPPNQPLVTPFDPKLEGPGALTPEFSDRKLNVTFPLATIVIASDEVHLELLAKNKEILSVAMGPKLDLTLDVSTKDLVHEIGEDLKEGESEDAIADKLSEQVAEDDAAAVDTDLKSYFNLNPKNIWKLVHDQVRPALLKSLRSWFDSLKPGSPDVQELEDEGVTGNDVPAQDAAAFEDESSNILASLGCDILAGGPEDVLGDEACFG